MNAHPKRRPAAQSASADDPARKAGRGERARLPLTISRPELLVNGSDRDFRHLVHAFFGFLARHEKIRDGHATVIGLAGIEYTVLISIAHLAADGDVNIKTVADHLHVSGAFITSIARRLLQHGLIHKRVDPADRRKVTLTLSAKGRGLIEKLAPVQRRVNDVEFGGLSKDEFRFLLDIIDRLIESGDRAVALQTYILSGLTAGDER
jgi:DNA-binding MarR family transcriptional regulator